MMDKREFLSALEQSLSVLQEDELRDIISEYEQHIDIKVEKGLTEEEAIADFGSFPELTAELLEAYHVRADYALRGKRGGWAEKICGQRQTGPLERWKPFCRLPGRAVREAESSSGYEEIKDDEGARTAFEEGGEDMGEGEQTGAAGRGKRLRPVLSEILEKWKGYWGRIRRKEKEDPAQGDGHRAREAGTHKGFGRIPGRREGRNMIRRGIGRGIRRIFRLTVDVVSWGVRMIWNGCWLLFALTAAGFGLVSLYGLGVLAVLLAQGYPLAGVTLGCLGLVMCTFSAAVFGMTLLRRRRNMGKETVMRESGSEAEPEEDQLLQWEEANGGLQEEENKQTEKGRREEETVHA